MKIIYLVLGTVLMWGHYGDAIGNASSSQLSVIGGRAYSEFETNYYSATMLKVLFPANKFAVVL